MPNWCTSELRVIGDIEDIKRFDKQFKEEHNRYSGGTAFAAHSLKSLDELKRKNVDVNPLAFKDGKVSEYIYIGEVIVRKDYSFNNFVKMTKQDFLNGWYEWAVDNWGTKWDVNDVETEDAVELDDDVWSKWYLFDTAWSPARPVFLEMSKQYPELEFELDYEDEGDMIEYSETYFNGERFE